MLINSASIFICHYLITTKRRRLHVWVVYDSNRIPKALRDYRGLSAFPTTPLINVFVCKVLQDKDVSEEAGCLNYENLFLYTQFDAKQAIKCQSIWNLQPFFYFYCWDKVFIQELASAQNAMSNLLYIILLCWLPAADAQLLQHSPESALWKGLLCLNNLLNII